MHKKKKRGVGYQIEEYLRTWGRGVSSLMRTLHRMPVSRKGRKGQSADHSKKPCSCGRGKKDPLHQKEVSPEDREVVVSKRQ